MKTFLLHLDHQIEEALRLGKQFTPTKPKKIEKILFCGMGGSAICGDILRAVVSQDTDLPFKVNRSGELPKWVDSKTLVILSSYSGNSLEILHLLPQLLKIKAPMIIVSAGGKLAEIATQKKISWLKITGGMMPRCAIGYMTFSILPLLRKWGWAQYSDKEMQEVISIVRKAPRAQAKELAKKLHGRFVHLYGNSHFAGPVLTRWRAQLAENSKTLASQHLIPEMLHNEIEGWKFPKEMIKNSAAIFFFDRNDPQWLTKKIKAAQEMIRQTGASVYDLKSHGNSLLARLFSLITLGDWTSYELALLNKVDPLEIPSIEALKKVPL